MVLRSRSWLGVYIGFGGALCRWHGVTEAGDVAVIAKMWPTFGGGSPQNRSSSAVHLPLNSQGFFLDLRAQDPQHPDAQSLCTFPSPARGKIERHVALLLPVRRRMVPRGSDLPSPPSNGNSAIQLSAPSMCAYAHEPWLPHHFFLHSIEHRSKLLYSDIKKTSKKTRGVKSGKHF